MALFPRCNERYLWVAGCGAYILTALSSVCRKHTAQSPVAFPMAPAQQSSSVCPEFKVWLQKGCSYAQCCAKYVITLLGGREKY